MNRRRADLVTKIWRPKAPAPKPPEEPTRRTSEIEAVVSLGLQRAETDPAHPNSALLHTVCVMLGELAAKSGILPLDREPIATTAGLPSEASAEPDAGTPVERFLAEIEAATDRGLAAGIFPPNLAAALRAEADRAEGGKG